MEIDKENLEKSLGENGSDANMSPEMEVGFHQGALNTLVAERNELYKMIQNVEKIMNLHLKRLEELGVKIDFKDNPQ